jgi:hypothetical protein
LAEVFIDKAIHIHWSSKLRHEHQVRRLPATLRDR